MKLQRRERLFVIVALVSAVVFVVLQFVVLPRWDNARSESGTLFEAQKELRNSRELLATKQLRDQVAALRSRLEEQNRRLLSAPDQNQAGAQFLTWLSTGASQQQLTFVRSEFLPAVPVGEKYLRIPVRLELMGRITAITQFLAAIANGDRLVSIDELELASNGDKEKRIRCTFVASALMARVK
jgi:Tfp pilus assembly protein PilO